MASSNDLVCATGSGNSEVLGGCFYSSLPSQATMVARDMVMMYKRKRSQSECLTLLQSGKSHAGCWSEIAFIALSTLAVQAQAPADPISSSPSIDDY